MGLTWAAGWAVVAFILSLAGFFGTGTFSIYVVFAVLWGVVGLVGGSIFSMVLGIAERRRRFEEMSLPRFAAWGGVGGLLLAIPWLFGAGPSPTLGEMLGTGVVMALLAAGSAAGSLALARRADDRELLDAGADVADIGLTEEEKRELLAG